MIFLWFSARNSSNPEVNSFQSFLFWFISCFFAVEMQIEDDCKLGSADEVAAAVHQVFSFINSSSWWVKDSRGEQAQQAAHIKYFFLLESEEKKMRGWGRVRTPYYCLHPCLVVVISSPECRWCLLLNSQLIFFFSFFTLWTLFFFNFWGWAVGAAGGPLVWVFF